MSSEDITVEILSRAAKEGLPHQIGPDESLDRIAIYAELIEANYLAGRVTRDGMGQPCNIGGARITAKGREYFHNLEKAQAERKASTKVKKSFRASAKWVFGIITALIIAIVGKWLLQKLGLPK